MFDLRRCLTTTTFALSAFAGAFTVAGCEGPPPPDDFDTFAVFLADGEIPEAEPPALVDDLSFFTDVMGWDQAQIDAFRAEKVAIAEVRFGIPDPENNPDVVVQIGTTNPTLDYRAVAFSDRVVPPSGWKNREGFVIVVAINELTLGGDFAGVTVPAGTVVGGGGMYNLEVTDPYGTVTGEEIEIDFTTAAPLTILPNGAFAFFCELDSDDFGDGLAEGVTQFVPLGGGILKTNIRNVLTWSDMGGL
ncbi:MAG: hypothetical protein AAGF11_05310 [Myxococcota bacterium]